VWDLLFAQGEEALLRALVAAFTLHEAHLLEAEEVFDLRTVLDCDAGALIAALSRVKSSHA